MNPLIKVVDKCPPFHFTPKDKHRFQIMVDRFRDAVSVTFFEKSFGVFRALIQQTVGLQSL
jgi:hypothetical protein